MRRLLSLGRNGSHYQLARLWRLGALTALIILAGCTTPVGVDHLMPQDAYLRLHQNALNSGRRSDATQAVLHRYNLDTAFDRDPVGTLKLLHGEACKDDRRDLLYALSELNYLVADRQRRGTNVAGQRQSRDRYFSSAIYAYLYLFGQSHDRPPDPYDLRFRTACDLYNRSLALGLMTDPKYEALVELADGPRPMSPGRVEVSVGGTNFPWRLDQVEKFYSSDEFAVRGLTTRNRDPGLGTPLIAIAKSMDAKQQSLRVPATVFLRVQGDVRSWSAGQMTASLELYATFDSAVVQVNGQAVPLQTDTTAPIAHALNQSEIWGVGMSRFFSPTDESKEGITRMQPYTPGRIPVVFVHGTVSSPVWWAEMWNTLRADPLIRRRFQFWVFGYNSGNPITYSAARLRDELTQQINRLDPEGKDPALRQMVIVGHSQGGLLAKLTATDTGDKLWRIISKSNIDELNIDAKTREILRTNLFYQPLPFVKRVVFVCTPHRGSYLNTQLVQNILQRFMSLPGKIVNAYDSLQALGNQLSLPPELRRGVPTSLSGMTTNNPFLLTLAEIPVAPGIKANSIIAIKGDDQPPAGNDGVVAYTSAHVDYAESEFIVRSGHSSQGNPLAIEEVRRILLEHLNSLQKNE